MEFNYFYNETPLSAASLVEFYPYNSSAGLGDFTPNIAGDNVFQNLNESSGEDITILITLNKNNSNAQILLSNLDTNGWTIGIDSGNFLFLDVRNSLGNESYTFRNINLGVKNCLAIKKSSNTFTIHKYDLLSRTFESSEVDTVNPKFDIDSGSDLYLGGQPDLPVITNGLFRYFDGTVEQLAVIDGAIEDSYILNLLLGFQPLTLTPLVSTSLTKLTESYRNPEGLYVNNTSIRNYFDALDSGVAANIGTGKWLGTSTGFVSSLTFNGRYSFGTGVTSCVSQGTYYTGQYVGSGFTTPLMYFSDTVRANKVSGTVVISHNLTFLTGATYHVDRDAYYLYNETSSGNSFATGSAYYTGFKMQGVFSDKTSRIGLATDAANFPTGYNKNGVFDFVSGKFYLNDFHTGRIYYNGDLITGYSINSFYLNYSPISQSGTDYLVYDLATGLTFLSSGTGNWATGLFYPNASLAFSGIIPSGRLKRTDYKETVRGHLYHTSSAQPTGTTFLFNF